MRSRIFHLIFAVILTALLSTMPAYAADGAESLNKNESKGSFIVEVKPPKAGEGLGADIKVDWSLHTIYGEPVERCDATVTLKSVKIRTGRDGTLKFFSLADNTLTEDLLNTVRVYDLLIESTVVPTDIPANIIVDEEEIAPKEQAAIVLAASDAPESEALPEAESEVKIDAAKGEEAVVASETTERESSTEPAEAVAELPVSLPPMIFRCDPGIPAGPGLKPFNSPGTVSWSSLFPLSADSPGTLGGGGAGTLDEKRARQVVKAGFDLTEPVVAKISFDLTDIRVWLLDKESRVRVGEKTAELDEIEGLMVNELDMLEVERAAAARREASKSRKEVVEDLFDYFGEDKSRLEIVEEKFNRKESEIRRNSKVKRDLLFSDITAARDGVKAERNAIDAAIANKKKDIAKNKKAGTCYGYFKVKCTHKANRYENYFGTFRQKVTSSTQLFEFPSACPSEMSRIDYNLHEERHQPGEPGMEMRDAEKKLVKDFTNWFDKNSSLVGCEENTKRRYGNLYYSSDLKGFVGKGGMQQYRKPEGGDEIEVSRCVEYPLEGVRGVVVPCPSGGAQDKAAKGDHQSE